MDGRGSERTAVVGRIKVESRPLVLVEAETEDGRVVSTLLQNAETVKLVGPAIKAFAPTERTCTQSSPQSEASASRSSAGSGDASQSQQNLLGVLANQCKGSLNSQQQNWRALSVSHLAEGDRLLVYVQVRLFSAIFVGIKLASRQNVIVRIKALRLFPIATLRMEPGTLVSQFKSS